MSFRIRCYDKDDKNDCISADCDAEDVGEYMRFFRATFPGAIITVKKEKDHDGNRTGEVGGFGIQPVEPCGSDGIQQDSV
jgi:hypothetical protein